jgi:hypothetical protein
LEELVTHAVVEFIVDHLEIIEINEEHGRLAPEPSVPTEQLFNAVEDETTVREPGQAVVIRLEGDSVLTCDEFFVQILALDLEDLRHAHERYVQASLQHRKSLLQAFLHSQPCGVVAQPRGHGIVPSQTALHDLVEGGVMAGCQLGEQSDGLQTVATGGLGVATRQPQGKSSGRCLGSGEKYTFDGFVEHT